MANWSEFTVSVTGPAADQNKVKSLLESFPHKHTDVVDASGYLPDYDENNQKWWEERGDSTCNIHGDTLTFSGAMKWAPPYLLLHKMSGEFPTLTFVCESTTEHQLYERRQFSGGEVELLEELLDDLQSDSGEPTRHYLKDGEISVRERGI